MRLLLLILLLVVESQARQAPRWLRLCDKVTTAERGSQEWENAPLRADLLDSLRRYGWAIRTEYRWENLVSAEGEALATLPKCVEDRGPVARGVWSRPTPPVAARNLVRPGVDPSPPLVAGVDPSPPLVAGVDPATQSLKLIWEAMGVEEAWRYLGKQKPAVMAGTGVTVAVIDSKFARGHKVLAGMNIADSWDFVDSNAQPWDSLRDGEFAQIHGASVAGLIGSRWDGLPGIAPGATFLLYRTENDASESPVEEDYLAAALVRAVDHGAQIVSISLGYRFLSDRDSVGFHPWMDFDGRHLVASRAATAAARRGSLVVVAAGNDARWGGRSIGSPADADSVLVVGAIAASGKACSFSSWGPTADGRPKPDVVSFGCYVPVAGSGGVSAVDLQGGGTSFAAPLVAGVAVLARQLQPRLSSMALLSQLRTYSSLAASPDSVRGNGLPDLRRIPYLLTLAPVIAQPLHWSPSERSFRFQIPSSQGGGKLELELATLSGRVLFRRSGAYQYGMPVWTPQGATPAGIGILVARWSGDYGAGAQRVMVPSR